MTTSAEPIKKAGGRVQENLLALFARRGDAAAREELVGLFMADIRRCVGAAVGARRVREFEGAGVAHVLERLGAWDPEANGTVGVSDFRPFALGTLRYRVLDAAQRESAIGGVWVPRSAWRSEQAAPVRRMVRLDAPSPERRWSGEDGGGREVAGGSGDGSWGGSWGGDPLDALIAAEELELARRCA